MLAMLHLLRTFVANLFNSRRRLEVENLFLRHQLNIALRRSPHRLRLRRSDRALLVWMTWLWPSLLAVCPASFSPTRRMSSRSSRLTGGSLTEREISNANRPETRLDASAGSSDEQGEPIVGRPAHPW